MKTICSRVFLCCFLLSLLPLKGSGHNEYYGRYIPSLGFYIGQVYEEEDEPYWADDSRCLAEGGTCHNESVRECHGGHFVPGLCRGSTLRECCLPGAPGNADVIRPNDTTQCDDLDGYCQPWQWEECWEGNYIRNLCPGSGDEECCVDSLSWREDPNECISESHTACFLVDEPLLELSTSHPSGIIDNSTAYNNLVDMCDSGEAYLSSYHCDEGCSAPGGSVCLSSDLVDFLEMLAIDDYRVRVVELAGGCHNCNSSSAHFRGLAVDLEQLEGPPGYVIRECSVAGGLPSVDPDNANIVHCEFTDD